MKLYVEHAEQTLRSAQHVFETMLLPLDSARRIRATRSVEGTKIGRRGFLSSFAGIAGAASALGLPPNWDALLEQEPPKLPDSALYGSNEEAYWTELRKQFLIPADEVYLNNGTVGSSPMPVLRCAIASVNIAPMQIYELESWMWKEKKNRIRGGGSSKLRLATPYYLPRKDVERFLGAFDEYRQTKKGA